MRYSKIVLAAGLCLTLMACQTTPGPGIANGKIETPVIELQVTNGQLGVAKNSNSKKCSGSAPNAKGCIVTDLGDISLVKFELKGAGQYSLKTLWICDSVGKPVLKDPTDPESFDCKLLGDRPNEFLVIAGGPDVKPNAAGIVDLGDVREFYLLNQNSFAGDYFYLIKACRSNGTCSIMDPRIRNGGRYVIR